MKQAGDRRVVAIEPLGLSVPMFDLTTGTGDFLAEGVVAHNCFARPSHEYLGFSAGLDFETRIVAKPELPRLLARLAERAQRSARRLYGDQAASRRRDGRRQQRERRVDDEDERRERLEPHCGSQA